MMRFIILALLALQVGIAEAAPDWRADGPKSVLMTVQAKPADRLKLRDVMTKQGVARFEDLRAQGKIAKYQILFSRYVDNTSWDMAVLLQFASSDDLGAWKAVELKNPAGLPDAALPLVTSISAQPADLVFSGTAAAKPSDPAPVYLVVPYDYMVSTDEYLDYLDTYVTAQTKGWMAEGVLQSYDVYVSRYGAGRAWASLLVLGYNGDAGLAARDKTTAKVRKSLGNDAAWKAFHEKKEHIRVEKQPVVADPLKHP